MATKKKMLQAASGQAGGAGLDIDEVFSTYLYDGSSAAQTITNGIDLAGEGGLVWTKGRTANGFTTQHSILDTERGGSEWLRTNSGGAELTYTNFVTSFNSNGFTIGTNNQINYLGEEYTSWTFRKAKKFFDIIRWTGDGTGDRTLSHNLDCEIGSAFVKSTSTGGQYGNWCVYHRSLGESQGNYLTLNSDAAMGGGIGIEPVRNPTHNNFLLRGGGAGELNVSGVEYVAYLFAHNNNDGEFGPDSDQDIIKCGVYSGNDASQEIDVGFEPQWLMIKRTTGTGDWIIYDSMRNWMTSKNGSGDSSSLQPNNTDYESAYTRIHPSANGFGFDSEAGSWANQSSHNYIYIAIRRGPLAVPEDATEVFGTDGMLGRTSGSWFRPGFPADFALLHRPINADEKNILSRLTGDRMMRTDATNAETGSSNNTWDHMDGWHNAVNNTTFLSHMWKRAPGFFDVVATTATNSNVKHNLGVVPELAIYKVRSIADDWMIATPADGYLRFPQANRSGGYGNGSYMTNASGVQPTATTINDGGWAFGGSYSYPVIIYLFATLPGISKVGTYTGDGTSGRQIDCGLNNSARFVLIKSNSATGDWLLWNSNRGIVSGNEPYLELNKTNAELTGGDHLDPHASGFIINGPGNNINGVDYVFYAVA
jgi:hypothetical protein